MIGRSAGARASFSTMLASVTTSRTEAGLPAIRGRAWRPERGREGFPRVGAVAPPRGPQPEAQGARGTEAARGVGHARAGEHAVAAQLAEDAGGAGAGGHVDQLLGAGIALVGLAEPPAIGGQRARAADHAEHEQQQCRPHAAAAPPAPPAGRHGAALGHLHAVGLRRHASGLPARLSRAVPWFKARPWSLAAVWPNARSWSLAAPLSDGTVGGAVEVLLEQDLRRGGVD